MLSEEKIDQLIIETRDAYSFDRFGQDAWRKSIENLSRLNYTYNQIKVILESKYMRWAGDEFAPTTKDKDGYEIEDWGNFTGEEIALFHEKHHNQYAMSRMGKLKPS
jgi:hypothetical protein